MLLKSNLSNFLPFSIRVLSDELPTNSWLINHIEGIFETDIWHVTHQKSKLQFLEKSMHVQKIRECVCVQEIYFLHYSQLKKKNFLRFFLCRGRSIKVERANWRDRPVDSLVHSCLKFQCLQYSCKKVMHL